MSEEKKLIRGLGLTQATALNMIDMVGIGPFITISFVIGAMNGPQCILAWLLGAALSFMDGSVWAELGAAYPRAGGSYVFLQKLFGEKKWGSLFAFIYIWQTSIQAPLVIASGAIGFSHYFTYLFPLDEIQQKMLSGGLVIFLTILLYRKVTDIGKISVFMWLVVAGTLFWVIIAGLTHFDSRLAFTYPEGAFQFSGIFFIGLGHASTKTIYSFLGYYNVCHLGGEIKQPEKNIPRSIFISITCIAILYLFMQISILGVVPWQEAKESPFVVSLFFEHIYGGNASKIATACILFVAIASLFSAMLGYSRIPYAAALDGNYFKIFAKVHPTKHFPSMSLLILGAVAFIFSLLFRLSEVIDAIIIVRILIQFVSQAVGLIALHYRRIKPYLPFRMWLFPLPAILSICIWLFIFLSADWHFMLGALAVMLSGVMIFLFRARTKKEWPFADQIRPAHFKKVNDLLN